MGRVTLASTTSPSATTCAGMTPYGAPQAARAGRAQRQREHASDPRRGRRRHRRRRRRRRARRQPLPRPRVHRAARGARRLPRPRARRATRSGRRTARTRCCSRCCRPSAARGARVLGFAPTYSMHPLIAAGTGTAWVAGRARRRLHARRPQTVGAAGRASTSPTSCSSARRTTPPARRSRLDVDRGGVRRDRRHRASSTRRTPSSRRATQPSALTLLPGRERLVVSRTMSKAFAFAGARVGYLAADPAVVDALRLVRLPYHLSALTQAAAVAALAHAPEMLAMVDEIVAQRDRISRELAGARLPPRTKRGELRAVRRRRRPARDVRGAARPRHPDPRRRHPGPPARHGGHRGRDDRVPRGARRARARRSIGLAA